MVQESHKMCAGHDKKVMAKQSEEPKQTEELNDEQLQSKLIEWLQSAPLYTEYRYAGATLVILPNEIQMFCEQCQRETVWRINRAQSGTDKGQYQQRSYRCANCKEQTIYFCYSWYEEAKIAMAGKQLGVSVFRKYGQWPAIEQRVKKELEKALGMQDLKFYKTALRLRNFGNGIGAMAYMRRVIENHMNEMIDILKEESEKMAHAGRIAKQEIADKEEPATQGIPKQEIPKQEIPSRFLDKVDYAAKLFPAAIAPEGYPNPMKPLYTLASDAIHNLPEVEAVTIFDECRKVFEYVFSSLRPALKERRAFLDSLQAVADLSAKTSK